MKLKNLLFSGAAACAVLGIATPAAADPATIAAAITAVVGPTISASTIGAFVIATSSFLLSGLISSKLISALQKQQTRQASVMELTLGEAPREYLFGTTCTGAAWGQFE